VTILSPIVTLPAAHMITHAGKPPLLAAFLTATVLAFAQDSISESKFSIGCAAGPAVRWTSVNGQSLAMVGIEAGLALEPRLTVGGGVYGLDRRIQANSDGQPAQLSMWYGGAEVEYVALSVSRLDLAASALIGAGQLRGFLPSLRLDVDRILVLEPGIAVVLRVFDFARIDVGLGYRRAFLANNLSNSAASGFSGVLGLRLGNL
jgi:hypothetical protein